MLILEKWFNRFADALGWLCSGLLLLLVLNVSYNVFMRYAWGNVSIGMQELEWHLFSAIFLVGIAYTLKEDAHVRVDMFYERLGTKKRAVINIAGAILFLIPFILLIITSGIPFVVDSYQMQEGSGDPGGLPHRFLVKGLIPLSFVFLAIATVGFIIHNINLYRGTVEEHYHSAAEELI